MFFYSLYLLALVAGFLSAYIVTWLPAAFQIRFPHKHRLFSSALSVALSLLVLFGLDVELPGGVFSAPGQLMVLSSVWALLATVAMSVLALRAKPRQ